MVNKDPLEGVKYCDGVGLSKIYSAMKGALLGDALGVPFEFKSASEIPAAIELFMPADYPKTYPHIPYATWSDDGSQLLCVLDCFLRPAMFDAADLGQRLLAWRNHGWHEAGGKVYDIGATTSEALDRLLQAVPAQKSGSTSIESNGNGALMRCLPAAMLNYDHAVIEQGAVTHAHPISLMTCLLYSQLVKVLMHDPSAPLNLAVEFAIEATRCSPCADHRALQIVLDGQDATPRGTGYVVDTFWSAVDALARADNYIEAVRNAIRFGNDTDTTACATGGLAALRFGLNEQAETWFNQLVMPAESLLLLNKANSTKRL
jgi:ADP-ribosylglycohydrolase